MWVIIIVETFLYIYHVSAIDVNLASGKPVWEDQPWKGTENWRGGRAVDGLYTDRSAHGGQCVVSENFAQTATWRVDLGGVVSVSHIDIYYRTENKPRPSEYTSRMAGFSLYVSNTTSKEDGHLCFHETQTVNSTPSENQRINCSVHGRYVIYYNERLPNVTYPSYYSEYAFYELCELEVYGCNGNGFYGPTCSDPCPTNCKESECDFNTGHCLGCVPGYQGSNCTQVCSQRTYGQDCLQSCGNCSNKETCNHVNGMCLHGCNEWVQGRECKTECTVGHFGKDCKYQCSENCNVTRRCNRFTGECDEGCKTGWTGSMCNQKCPPGSFGMNCLYKCDVYCTGKETCDHVTGVCDEGCKQGWNSPLCNKGIFQGILSGFGNILIWIVIATTVVIVIFGGVLCCVCCKWRKVSSVEERHVQQLSTEHTETENNGEKAGQSVDLQEVCGYDSLNEQSHIYSN